MTRPTNPPPEEPVRPHTFDGIQEYDKRLPNWWLFTLYATIFFSAAYWSYFEWFGLSPSGGPRVDLAMAQIEAERMASAPALNDPSLWKASRNPVMIDAGQATFTASCVACHLASLRGKDENSTAIGPNLVDTVWIHGGRPSEVYDTITKGVPAKGMPTWGPVLGPKKITEVVAYILSHHQEGEPITAAPVP